MYHYLIISLVLGSALANIDPISLLPKDDIEKTIKAKCESNGGAQAFDNLDTAKDDLRTCVEAQINVTVFQSELEEAKKTGSMDEVFGKYCARTPQFKACFGNFTDALKRCLDEGERRTLDTALDVLKKLGEFMCYNDGDRLAMFIAEGGVTCLQEQTESIKTCLNNTFYNKIPTEINANSLPQIAIGKESCDDLNRLKDCVVEELEKCKNSTPANIIEALFRFIHRHACKNRTTRGLHRRSIEGDVIKDTVMKFMKKRCDEYGGKDAFNAFEAQFERSVKCFRSHVPILAVSHYIEEDSNQAVNDCVYNETVEATRDCLPEEEQYLVEYSVYSLRIVTKMTCQLMPQFVDMIDTPHATACLNKIKNTYRDLITCVKIDEKAIPKLVTKEILCRTLKGPKICIENKIKDACPLDIYVSQIFSLEYDFFQSPCPRVIE